MPGDGSIILPWRVSISSLIIATPSDGYVFSHWLQDGNEITGGPRLFVTYTTDPNEICLHLAIIPTATFSAVFNTASQDRPRPEPFYESVAAKVLPLTLHRLMATQQPTPTNGIGRLLDLTVTSYLTQLWRVCIHFPDFGNSDNNGTWKVEATNEAGTTAVVLNYRVYADSAVMV